MARICTGTSRCSTVATTTGAAGRLAFEPGAAACTSFFPQAARLAISATSAPSSTIFFLTTKLCPMLTSPIVAILPRARPLLGGLARQHPRQPDVGQGAADLLIFEFLEALAPEQLLHPGVIDDHPEKTSRREQRIDVAKLALLDALANVISQRLVIFGDVGAEKALRQAVVLQPAEQ